MNAPHVLLVAFHYAPEISPGVRRSLIMEEFLVRKGCRVTLLTHQNVTSGCHGSTILRVPLPGYLAPATSRDPQTGPRRKSLLRKWVRRWVLIPDVFVGWCFRAARRAIRECTATRFDLVITSSPPESVHWIGWQLKRRCRCRWLADFRDGWTFEPHRPEASLPVRRWVESRLERAVVEGADWVAVNARPVAEYLLRRQPREDGRIHVLPTGFAANTFEPKGQDAETFRLVYTGRFTLSRPTSGPTPFLEGLRQALETDREFAAQFRLVLMGYFTESERALWSAPPLSAVVQEFDTSPYEEAMRLAAGATMLLLLSPRGLQSVIPRKLFDYLAARRPIFALTEENEITRILRETSSGVWVSPWQPSRISEELLRMFRLWRAGRLDKEIPCSANELYQAETHFSRVLGDTVLAGTCGGRQSET